MRLLVITKKVDKNDQLLGFFIEWLRLFSGKFEKLEVLCLEKGNYDLPANVRVHSMGKDRKASKLKQLFNFYKFILARHQDYDAVFVHMNPIWVVLGGYFWKIFDKKIFFWYTSGGVTLKLKIAAIVADVIFTASPESFRLKSKKVVVTGHGIDTELFKPDLTRLNLQGRFNLKILSVGRISPVKNYETLIDACKILKDKNVGFLVTIVGEPALESDREYQESLRFKVKNLNLEDSFNFIGKVGHRDLPSYYQSHDLFVHLSKTGSLDKTILEAMACGMKVLSSSDAARGFLPDNLIFNENNAQKLAEKIIQIKDSQVSESLRSYVVENHNLVKLIDKLTKIIYQ